MIIEYRDNETRKICEDKSYARKRLLPSAAAHLEFLMYQLHSYNKFEMLRRSPTSKKYRIHQLQGKESHLTSLSIDYSIRMTLIVTIQIEEDHVLIWEVSNHYGD